MFVEVSTKINDILNFSCLDNTFLKCSGKVAIKVFLCKCSFHFAVYLYDGWN